MDHSSPSPSQDLRARERVEGVLVDVIAAQTTIVGEHFKTLDCVEDHESELRHCGQRGCFHDAQMFELQDGDAKCRTA